MCITSKTIITRYVDMKLSMNCELFQIYFICDFVVNYHLIHIGHVIIRHNVYYFGRYDVNVTTDMPVMGVAHP